MAPLPPKKLVLAASSADTGVAAWDLRTGAERGGYPAPPLCLPTARARLGRRPIPHRRSGPSPLRQLRHHPLLPLGQAAGGRQELPGRADPRAYGGPGGYLIGDGGKGNIYLWHAGGG